MPSFAAALAKRGHRTRSASRSRLSTRVLPVMLSRQGPWSNWICGNSMNRTRSSEAESSAYPPRGSAIRVPETAGASRSPYAVMTASSTLSLS